jgi:hypothetical protein
MLCSSKSITPMASRHDPHRSSAGGAPEARDLLVSADVDRAFA